MKTQIYPPPGADVGGKSTVNIALIVGGVIVIGAIIYFIVTKNKKRNGEEKIYSGNE